MKNIKSISIYDDRGNENDEGNNITVTMKRYEDPTIEDETQVFNELLDFMKMSRETIYYYIEFVVDGDLLDDDEFLGYTTSFELAKKLGRTQEIKDIVNSWLDS